MTDNPKIKNYQVQLKKTLGIINYTKSRKYRWNYENILLSMLGCIFVVQKNIRVLMLYTNTNAVGEPVNLKQALFTDKEIKKEKVIPWFWTQPIK